MRLIITLATVAALYGCSLIGTKNIHYDYHKPSEETKYGLVNVSFNPDPKFINESDVVHWKSPYYFNTQYIALNSKVCRGEIRDLTISSAQSGKMILTLALQEDSTSRRTGNKKKCFLGSLGFGLSTGNMPYEDYLVSFDYVVYGENQSIFEQGHVSVIVERNYFEDHR